MVIMNGMETKTPMQTRALQANVPADLYNRLNAARVGQAQTWSEFVAQMAIDYLARTKGATK